jgi:iron complex transport system substrate-binding protein
MELMSMNFYSKKRFPILTLAAGLLLIAGLVLAACSPQSAGPELPEPSPTPAPIVLTDGLGRTVTLESPASRVVSLAPSNTEILYAVGASGQVVGRDEFANYPPEAVSLPSVGGSFGQYSIETIVNLQPDLVLAAEINTPEQVQAIEQVGLTVFLLPNPLELEGMYQNLNTVARLTGHEEQAAGLIELLKERVAAVVQTVEAVSERPTVFYELDSTDPSAPYTAGANTFIDLLIGMAGGQNAAGSIDTPWAQISIEELLILNPEVILLGDAAYGVTVESVSQRAGWDGIRAVQEGRVYPFNDDLASRPGPRLVDGLEEMARLLHPDLFDQ